MLAEKIRPLLFKKNKVMLREKQGHHIFLTFQVELLH